MTVAKEALRQQMLLRALWRDARPGVLAGWTRDGERFTRGLQAYQANAGALAEKALAAAYPTVQQLLGAASFAGLARAFWHRQAPVRGDIGIWGEGLADFLADFLADAGNAAEGPAEEPYLPDVARLEWAVHVAATAADRDTGTTIGLHQLADHDPTIIGLQARPGTALVLSAHPVASIWLAHRPAVEHQADRFDAVREAFAQGRAEAALVWRSGWQVQVAAIDAVDARFTQQLLLGATLGDSLQGMAHETDFSFKAWLLAHLPRGWLTGARAIPS